MISEESNTPAHMPLGSGASRHGDQPYYKTWRVVGGSNPVIIRFRIHRFPIKLTTQYSLTRSRTLPPGPLPYNQNQIGYTDALSSSELSMRYTLITSMPIL